MTSSQWAAWLLVAFVVTGCAADERPVDDAATSTRPTATSPPSASPTASTAVPTASASSSTPTAKPTHRERRPDPRWQFFTTDHRWHRSPWFAGAHRIMIGFGCNTAPWYSHDERCPGDQGFHHGIDIAMSCGTPLLAGTAGVVLPLDAPGSPGTAYGVEPVRLRIVGADGPYDVLLGHTREVFVQPGEQVSVGQRIALASDSGAPDGCHLHFEVRPAGGDVTTAVDPARWLVLEAE